MGLRFGYVRLEIVLGGLHASASGRGARASDALALDLLLSLMMPEYLFGLSVLVWMALSGARFVR